MKPGMEPSVPAGAYYVLADASVVPGSDSVEKAMNLLELTGVASVPGRRVLPGRTRRASVALLFRENRQRPG